MNWKKWCLVACVCAGLAVLVVSRRGEMSAEDPAAASLQLARGVVFHDLNANGKRDAEEPGLPGVRVSNGVDIVKTDDAGRYEIEVDDDAIVFVVKPRNYRTPIDENQLPRFYYIHKPKGSPQLTYAGVEPTGPLPDSIDFPLYAQEEPRAFRALMFGDPQPRNQEEIDYITHDVLEELVGTDAAFGVTLGDIMFDDLSLFESQARAIALLGIPWYNVIGNHDINYDSPNDRYSDETYERVFGPSYYSFEYGPVHFIVLDDIEWYVPDDQQRGRYRGGLGPDQLDFVRNDLALIPDDQLVVLMMHIPLTDVRDRHELYRMIEQRPFCMSISGHTHHHEHRFITREDGWMGPEPHHHVINVTVCGSWWSGQPDERGIPHTTMADGAPNGYSIMSFDGHEYSLEYRVAGRPADYQMNIDAPEAVNADQTAETTISVNVFNGSEKSVVEMRLNRTGPWQVMQRTIIPDPAFVRISEREGPLAEEGRWRKLPKPKPCTHLWQAQLPGDLEPGTHLISIRARDMEQRVYESYRMIRVLE